MNHRPTSFRPGISAVIPVYNSAVSLPSLMERIEPVLAGISPEFEVILVDDGSRDRSWEVICELARRKRYIRGIQLMRNFGQHNALLCGIRAARHAMCVTLDDDGQNPPEEIPKLVRALYEGCDLVFGVPEKQQHGLCRTLASRLTKMAMQSVLGAETARQVSAFKLFRTRLRHSFADYSDAFVAIDVLLGWGAARVGSVPVRHDPRRQGESNYTFRRLLAHALNMVTSFSVVPLQLASITGFFFTLFGIGVLGYVLGRYFIQGASVAGFPFLASITAIFAGAQLFALGIIGEYIARIHFRSMKKPAYAVAEEVASAPPGNNPRRARSRIELTRA
jgi:glycosyltransferase involved in cell wall biosynthesis